MSEILICYRRKDAQGITGRIFDRLVAHFGSPSVFIDIDNIPYGVDFREHIAGALDRCNVLLAIIGPRWFGDGKRLDDDADWVRIEIETAFAKKIPVIPVLVEQAQMPKASDLPESLRGLAFLNAAQVDSGLDFKVHSDRLIRVLEEKLKPRPAPPPVIAPPPAVSPAPAVPQPPAFATTISAPPVASPAPDLPKVHVTVPFTSPGPRPRVASSAQKPLANRSRLMLAAGLLAVTLLFVVGLRYFEGPASSGSAAGAVADNSATAAAVSAPPSQTASLSPPASSAAPSAPQTQVPAAPPRPPALPAEPAFAPADFESVMGLTRKSTLDDAIRLYGPITEKIEGTNKFGNWLYFSPGSSVVIFCKNTAPIDPKSAIGTMCESSAARQDALMTKFRKEGDSQYWSPTVRVFGKLSGGAGLAIFWN